MSIDVETSTVIERPVDVVAAYASDPSNAPKWYAKIESVVWETDPPVVVGSKVAFVANFLRKRLEYTYEIVEYVPSERLVMRTDQGPFPMETTYTWSPRGDGTSMTLRNRGVPTGFSALARPVMSFAIRRANNKDLAALKALLEST